MASSQPRDTTLSRRKNAAPSASGVPLVLIHGFRGTRQGLSLIAKELSATGEKQGIHYALHAPDLPGFGRGAQLKDYSLDSYVEWLHSYMKKTQAKFPRKKIHLLGHSFGSIICAAYAAKYPRSIQSLVLVNPIGAPALEGPKKTLTKLAILYYRVGAALPRNLAHAWLASPLIVRIMSVTMAKTKDADLRKYIHGQHSRYFSLFHSPASVLDAFKTSVNHTVRDFAADIPVKTLLVAGSLDDITPLSDQYALAKHFPSATLKVIDHVGHLTHYETPDTVAKHVQAFIKSV